MLARHDRNKNVLAVVRSFARLLARKPEWPGRLIIVGKQGRQTPELFKFLASCPKLDKVILKSKVTEVELRSDSWQFGTCFSQFNGRIRSSNS